jgi:4-hydroxy-tetrahydrodipicolinate reductase
MNDELHIGLIGAEGRLGRAIAAFASPSLLFTSFTRAHPPSSSAGIGVFLDVSSPAAIEQNLEAALSSKKPLVVGTTGHADFDLLKKAAESIPLFYSANFSLGIALMRQAAVQFARRFHPLASIGIIEAHHANKKDAPSGTALMLGRAVEESHPAKVEIQSIRSGQIVGKHELRFQSADEHLVLIHEAQSLNAFAQGAIAAARFLAVQSPGFYTMDDLLKMDDV